MDATVFANTYKKGIKSTINFLSSRGIPRDMAPECAQAAWAKGWERLKQLRDESLLVSWVNSIALNHSRRAMKKARHEVAWTQDRERRTEMDLAAIDVASILQSCEPKDRELLEAQLQGRSAQELAAETGLTETAMRLRCLRARRAARENCRSRAATHLRRLRTSDLATSSR
jgi:RNA polymerase sigma factor (sigma-70 family)